MAEFVKNLQTEVIFVPSQAEKDEACPGCPARGKKCNRFGDNGWRTVGVSGVFERDFACDVWNLIQARKAAKETGKQAQN